MKYTRLRDLYASKANRFRSPLRPRFAPEDDPVKHTRETEDQKPEASRQPRSVGSRQNFRRAAPFWNVEALVLAVGLVSLLIVLLGSLFGAASALTFLASVGLFLVPGFLASHLILGDAFTGLARLPVAFVLSTGVFGLLGVPLLVLNLGFGLYLLICGLVLAGTLALAAYRLFKMEHLQGKAEAFSFSLLWLPFAGLSAVLAYASTVTVEEPNGDSWVYLAYVREHLGGGRLAVSDAIFGLQGGDLYLSTRTMLNGWLLVQTALSWVSGVPPVELVLDYLAPVLVIVSLLAVYSLVRLLLGREAALFVGSLTALLLLVDLQATVQTAFMSSGHEIVARVTEDKYVTRFLFLPVALGLSFLYLKERKLRYLLVFAFLCWSVAVVHPIGLVFIGVCAAGFGFFHLVSNLRDGGAWKRVLLLGAAVSSIALPPLIYLLATGSPLLSRLEGSADSSTAQALVSLWADSKRLLVLGEDGYMMHPALLLNPVVFLAYALGVPFLIVKLKESLAARLLLGALVFTAALIYVPFFSTPLAKAVGPWVLFRFSWIISLAAPIVLGWMVLELIGYLNTRFAGRRPWLPGHVARALPLLVVVVLVAAAAPVAWASVRSANELDEVPQDGASCYDPTFGWMREEIEEPLTVLAPYEENSCIPAYSAAEVLTFRGTSPGGLQDAAGSFFLPGTLGEEDVQFLLENEVDYVLMPSGSPLNAQIHHLPGVTPLDNPGRRYRVYEIDRNALTATPAVSANTLLDSEDLAGAGASYSSALAGGADEQFLAYVGLGTTYTRQGLYEEAAASYEQALSIYPEEPTLYPLLSGAYGSAGNQGLARLALENAVERFPEDVSLRTELSNLLADGDRGAAVEVQRGVVETFPEVPDHRIRLGNILNLAGESGAAEEQFRKAIAQNPLSAELHSQVGFANQTSGEREAAIRHYERALDLNPSLQEAQQGLEEVRGEG